MSNWLLVAVGGALGASLRYGMALWLVPLVAAPAFPWHTLVANWLGAVAIGVGWGLWQYSAWFLEWGRPLLFVGFLGGFTTFSAFSLECLQLVEQGRSVAALAYAGLSVLGCLLLVFAGRELGLTIS